MSSEERGFSRGELIGVGVFSVLATLLGIGAYQIGYHRISGVQGGGAAMSASQQPAPVNGQTLFAGNCAGCHGANAGGGVGPALKASASWDAAAFKEAVMNGKTPDGRTLKAPMPQYAKVGLDGSPATDEQLNALYEYVKSLP